MTSHVALIVDADPLLADTLRTLLAQTWPELQVLPVAPDGVSAIAAIAQAQPDVVFLDIAMPDATALDVARACARLARPPQIVFVTAFERATLDVLDAAAVDYLLKPVAPDRLARTVARVRDRLAAPDVGTLAPLLAAFGAPQAETIASRQFDADLAQRTVSTADAREYLRFVRACGRDAIHLVPVDDVCFFEAADKHVMVATVDGDLRIRTSLRELLPQLDPSRFWQVHRSTVVNVAEVVSAQHTPLGRLTLKLKRRKDRVAVSRQYAHLFRQM